METSPASRPLAIFALLGVLALGLAAAPRAWSEDPPVAPPAAAPSQPPKSRPAVLKLLEAGEEPRETMRIAVGTGHKEKATLAMKMEGTSKGAPLPLPNYTMAVALVVNDVDAQGDAHYAMSIEKVDVDAGPGAASGMKERLQSTFEVMTRARITSTVTARGEVKDTAFTLPDDAPVALKASMDGTMTGLKDVGPILLPEEAIGIGARWQLSMAIAANGLALDQTATYTLKSRDGTRYTLSAEIESSAKPQEMKVATLPPGWKMEVLRMTSKGSGELTFDLKRLTPVESTLAVAMSQTMKFTMGETVEEIPSEMKMTLEMKGEVEPATTGR